MERFSNKNKMNKPLKDYITPFIPRFIVTSIRNKCESKMLKVWQGNGSPVPPPHIVKQMAIEEYRRKYGYSIFIEAGW
jgi:hypothetical protein